MAIGPFLVQLKPGNNGAMRGLRSLPSLPGRTGSLSRKKVKNNPMQSRNTPTERHIVRSVKPLPRRTNQRQTGNDRGFRCAAPQFEARRQFECNRRPILISYFTNSILTRRAKQWHYAIIAHSRAAPASRHRHARNPALAKSNSRQAVR